MKAIGVAVSLLFVIVVGALIRGFVLSILWGWFLVPVFHVSQINIPLAIGISLLVGMLTPTDSSTGKNEEKKGIGEVLVTSMLFPTISPMFALGVGAIVHAFV